MGLASRVIALLGLVWPAVAGDITGHAVITKRLTKRTLSPIIYNLRGLPPPSAGETESINEFDRMVVMLEGGPARSNPPVTAVLDQRNIRFDPDLIVIPIGSTVEFPNSDPIFHNVFSLSKVQPFDLGFYPRGQSRSVKFNRPGIVQVYCHIHANMYAAIVVAATPWYAKPASDGSFGWRDVPPGHYRLLAWHKIAGLHSIPVDVPTTGAADFTIRVPIDGEPRP